jgi:hypothetical protein
MILHVLIFYIDNCLINGTQIYYDSYDSLRSKTNHNNLEDQRSITFVLQVSILN